MSSSVHPNNKTKIILVLGEDLAIQHFMQKSLFNEFYLD